MAGVAIGSGMGSKIIEVNKLGIRNLIVIFNLISIFANCLKQIASFETIMAARLIWGICTGILNNCLGKILTDTIPNEVS